MAAAKPAPASAPQTSVVSPLAAAGKPDYASLIDPKNSARQMRCLAEAIYFEARSEPESGQAAVAQVVLNRVRSGIFPTNVCAVVYQDRNRPFACQFSFACEGKSLRVEEPAAWATATRIAQAVVTGANYNPKVAEALNYHANYVYPFWAPSLRKVDRIGAHIFYAMRFDLNWGRAHSTVAATCRRCSRRRTPRRSFDRRHNQDRDEVAKREAGLSDSRSARRYGSASAPDNLRWRDLRGATRSAAIRSML